MTVGAAFECKMPVIFVINAGFCMVGIFGMLGNLFSNPWTADGFSIF